MFGGFNLDPVLAQTPSLSLPQSVLLDLVLWLCDLILTTPGKDIKGVRGGVAGGEKVCIQLRMDLFEGKSHQD